MGYYKLMIMEEMGNFINHKEFWVELLNTSDDNIWVIDTQLNIIFINNTFKYAYLKAFGLDLTNKSVSEMPHTPEYNKKWREYYDRALQGEIISFNDITDSKEIYINVTMKPIIINTKVVAVVCYGKDISEKVLAQKKVNEQMANLRTIIENTSDTIWAVDREYKILYINNNLRQEYIKAFGVDLKIGDSKIEWIPKEIQDIWKRRYDRALSGEKVYFEESIDTDSGMIYISVNMNPIIDMGKVIGVSCYGRNITQEKNIQKDLSNSKIKAEESAKLTSSFLANMSHEIRTPLNGILGFTQFLKEPETSKEEALNYISIIEKSGEHLLSIINDIIDISKLESGMVSLNMCNTNINDTLEYLYNFFNPEAHKKGVDLYLINKIHTSNLEIITDKEKLNAILTNLIKNALKFTSNGYIEICCSKINKNLLFYVKDSGCGIPENMLNSIFDRFIQAENSKTNTIKGSGLGLTICKSYVKMLGGSIWVQSNIGIGSTFYFTIPI